MFDVFVANTLDEGGGNFTLSAVAFVFVWDEVVVVVKFARFKPEEFFKPEPLPE